MQADPADHTPDPESITRRASRAAGANAALHRYDDAKETALLARSGETCSACAYVSALPWGAQACRRSREKASVLTIRRNRPIPFVCHMGFSCVSMVLAHEEAGDLVLTVGPYQPRDIPNALEADARDGLAKLEQDDRETLPFELADIPLASADAVPEVAAWCAEHFAIPDGGAAREPASPVGDAGAEPPRRRRKTAAGLPVSWAQDIVSALAAGDSDKGRGVIRSLLEEVEGPSRKRLALQRHRAHRILASVLEAAEFAGIPTLGVEQRMERFLRESALCRDEATLRRWVMKTLAPLKPSRAKDVPSGHADWLKPLDAYLDARVPEPITLEEAAAALELNPSTLTKRLQRKFRLSFSDYVGRFRVQRAKELLGRTLLSTREVARRVGLNDTSNFSKLFRRHTGLTPAQYRKQLDSKR